MTYVTNVLLRAQAIGSGIAAHVHLAPGTLLATGVVLSLLTGISGLWLLWRVRRLLGTVTACEQRMTSLSNSVALLTDTTESCFRALSMQLQFMQSQNARKPSRKPAEPAAVAADPAARKARQRRIVGAARRGEALTAIAAREQVAESEVALRLQVSEPARVVERAKPIEAQENGPLFL